MEIIMRYINDLSEPKSVTETVDGFEGCFEGGILHAENLSSDAFPTVRPRSRRARLGDHGKITAVFDDGITAMIEDGRLYIDGARISDEYFSDGFKHKLLRLGDHIVVMPDGFYCNIGDKSDCGAIRKSVYIGDPGITPVAVDGNFNVISEYTTLRTRPPAAERGDLWAKPKTDGGYEMKSYDGYEWRPYESYVMLKSKALVESFKKGDVLVCVGADGVFGNHVKVVRNDGAAIYFEGAVPNGETVSGFSLKRYMPILEQATVVCGRMVGVYCGYDENGGFVSRAYASALNDPLSWSEYGGGASADIGGSEPFTELLSFCGDAVAFREGSLVRLKLSDSGITFTELECDGIRPGSEGCAAVTDGYLYYKSPTAIYKYGGSLPERISLPLSGVDLCRAESTPAGACNGRFYIRLLNTSGRSGIYVYSAETKSWSVEDDPGVTEFFRSDGELLAICDSGEGSSVLLWNGDGASEAFISRFTGNGYPVFENAVRWSFETEAVSANIKKGIFPSKIFLKARVKAGSTLGAGCICNGRSVPERVVTVNGGNDGYFEIPMPVSKHGALRLSVFGRGEAEVYGYAVEYRENR